VTLSATLGLFGGAIVLVALPLVRASEMSEHESARERAEEPVLVHRVHLDRQLRTIPVSVVFHRLDRISLGHSQRPVFKSLDGHRLANGLLAPMTC
jgi:hypothetical protein